MTIFKFIRKGDYEKFFIVAENLAKAEELFTKDHNSISEYQAIEILGKVDYMQESEWVKTELKLPLNFQ
jgi:hypothetical protein